MQLMKYYICLLGIILILSSCQKRQDVLREQNTENLISYVIDKYAKALPPAPPLPEDTISSWELSKETIDSVLNVKLDIAIYPILEKPFLHKEVKIEIDKEYNDLIRDFSSIEGSHNIPIMPINKKSRHQVVLADTLILKKSKDWKEYDLLFQFSNISFNENFDKAAAAIGISRSALWGYGNLYLFEKKNKKWETVKSIKLVRW